MEMDTLHIGNDKYAQPSDYEDSPEIDQSYQTNRVKLQQSISSMDEEDKSTLFKIVQYRTVMMFLHALKNLKKTDKTEWSNLIGRMNIVKDIDFTDKNGINFSEVIKDLIPITGAIAGRLLAMRECEEKISEASEVSEDEDPLNHPSFKEDAERHIQESVVLQYCREKQNGFSF